MLWLSLLLSSVKKIRSKLKALEWPHHSTLNIDFSNTQGQITSRSEVGSGRNSNSYEMLRNVLVTFKNKEDPNKNEGARVATTLNIDFSHS